MVWNKEGNRHIPVDSTCNQMYKFLLTDHYVPIDLLTTFTAICQRDETDINHLSSKKIWCSLHNPALDYPKLADLYWKLIHGKVRTGEPWMERCDWPQCGTQQSAEHLFWTCPIAKRVWGEVARVWEVLEGDALHLPTKWSEALLVGIQRGSNDATTSYENGRWRIMFSELFWTLWTYRCAWSFREIESMTETGAVQRYRARVSLRYYIDRQQALDDPTGRLELFKHRRKQSSNERPKWIEPRAA